MKKFFSRRLTAASLFFHTKNLIQEEWKAILIIIIASTIQAFAVNYFTLHYRFPDLGLSGIAVLTNYVFGISPNWVIVTGDILFLIFARRDLSVKFFGLTLLAIFTFSTMLEIFSKFPLDNLPEDKFMATVIVGLLKGSAGALMINAGGSGGGTDILGVALRRRHGIEIGRFTILINFVILGLSISIIGLESVYILTA